MTLNFKFIGWNNNHGSDKVWGVIYLEPLPTRPVSMSYSYTNVLTFWAGRGHKLQSKIVVDDVKLSKLITKKINSGYKQVDTNDLNSLYDGFYTDLQKIAIWAILKK
jgi:hypothetical protein